MHSCSKELSYKTRKHQALLFCLFALLLWFREYTYLKYLKSGNIKDSQEGGSLTLGLVQGFVDSAQDPAEHTFVDSLSQSFNGKVSLVERRTGTEWEDSRSVALQAGQCLHYLLFSLSLLHHLPAHFYARGENGSSEVCHIDALQVTHLLGRWEKWGKKTKDIKTLKLLKPLLGLL